jgi:hypothetical protein
MSLPGDGILLCTWMLDQRYGRATLWGQAEPKWSKNIRHLRFPRGPPPQY